MHFHSPLDFSLEADAASHRGALASPSTLVAEAVVALGFSSFDGLGRHLAALPYGRVVRSGDPLAVLREGRGTGSSKHQLLATVAQGCEHFEVMLTVGLYAMSEANTPGVGAVLAAASVDAIPEARCYLTIDHQRIDFSGAPRGRASPFASLAAEYFLAPEVLAERKPQLHRQALAQWAPAHGLSEQAAWDLREACIAALCQPADGR
ncbi:MAG: hypothetical protein IPM01_24235 [Burkholderiaceae bacterium]|nr:hypothetical protein [Burkholderiaceae bacterium]